MTPHDSQLRYLASLVKARVTVPDVAARFGFDYAAPGRLPCPVCHEQSTTKQTVALYDEGARWFCFRCNAGGDCVDWLAARLDTTKRAAIGRLCSMLMIGPDDDSLVAYLKGTLARPAQDLPVAGRVASTLRELRRLRSLRLAKWLPPTFDQHGAPDNLEAIARVVAAFQFAAVAAHRGHPDRALASVAESPAPRPSPVDPDLLAALDVAAARYEANLAVGIAATPAAVEYLKRRNTAPALLRLYGAGFSGRSAEDLPASVREVLVAAGVLYASPCRHAVAGRLVLPFRAADGTPVAFAGRQFSGAGPKWLNTADSAAFSKRCYLFGLDVALSRLLATGRLVVVEGYSDCLAVHAAGEAAVATAGTSLTAEHVDSVRGLASDVVLVFDGDDAGRRASASAALALRGHVPSVREVVLSEGVDPDELPPAALRAAVAAAAPVAPTKTAEEWAEALRVRLAR